VSIVTRLLAGGSQFDSQEGKKGIYFLFATTSRPVLGPTQPPTKWVLGDLSHWIKRPRREGDHSSPSSAELKNEWSYTSTPAIRHCVVLI
jgi:hypothetical protein